MHASTSVVFTLAVNLREIFECAHLKFTIYGGKHYVCMYTLYYTLQCSLTSVGFTQARPNNLIQYFNQPTLAGTSMFTMQKFSGAFMVGHLWLKCVEQAWQEELWFLGDALENTGLEGSTLFSHLMTIGFGPFELPTHGLLQKGSGKVGLQKWIICDPYKS